MKHRALIIGSEGFAGPKLKERLETEGLEVLGCDVSIPPGAEDRIACNITDASAVREMLKKAGELRYIFHLAAVDFAPAANQDPARMISVNVIGTVNVIRAMKRYAPDARLVYVGSAECYGAPQELPVRETAALAPMTPYAISKCAADQYCRFAVDTSGLDIVRMRPFNHSGAGQSARFVLPSIARQIAAIEAGKQEAVLEVGNTHVARDFSHVADVARAYWAAAVKGRPGEAYNVCSGVGRNLDDVIAQYLRLTSVKVTVRQVPGRVRAVDVPELYGTHEKLTEHTGWASEGDFVAMLEEILAYWRDRAAG